MQKQTSELPVELLLPEHSELLEIIPRGCRPAATRPTQEGNIRAACLSPGEDF